jgi:putative intracellular protease/amidase
MTPKASDSGTNGRTEIRLDRLLGRNVAGRNGQRVGRLEEFRAEPHGKGLVVAAYVIGSAGLLERLGVGIKLLAGRHVGGYVARWDQLDISDPDRPRLTCGIEELERTSG